MKLFVSLSIFSASLQRLRILEARCKFRKVLLVFVLCFDFYFLTSIDGTLKCELVVCKSPVTLQNNDRTLKLRKENDRFSNMVSKAAQQLLNLT